MSFGMKDYKDWIQEKAEDIAREKYEAEFYDLPNEKQTEVYNQAIEEYKDFYASMIDAIYERLRDKEILWKYDPTRTA